MGRQPAPSPADPRPFIAYRPPRPQPTRGRSARASWQEARAFIDRVADPLPGPWETLSLLLQRWDTADGRDDEEYGPWPADCTEERFATAMRRAVERFGPPDHSSLGGRARATRLQEDHHWSIPIERVNELFEFLDAATGCIRGVKQIAPVSAFYGCSFWLRDPATRVVLPGQGFEHLRMASRLDVLLQDESAALMQLLLPFADASTAADYLVALQQHAPVHIDPRYFDQCTPTDTDRYDRRRLPLSWIGEGADGQPRLDPARSGLVPRDTNLPTDADLAAEDREQEDEPFHAAYYWIKSALETGAPEMLLISGPYMSSIRYIVEQAAGRLGLGVQAMLWVGTGSPSGSEVAEALAGSGGRAMLLLVEIPDWVDPYQKAAVVEEAGHRIVGGVALPASVRVVLAEGVEAGPVAAAAERRLDEARQEGFLSSAQADYLAREAQRAAWREITVAVARTS